MGVGTSRFIFTFLEGFREWIVLDLQCRYLQSEVSTVSSYRVPQAFIAIMSHRYQKEGSQNKPDEVFIGFR
jgi:hypothetical protein